MAEKLRRVQVQHPEAMGVPGFAIHDKSVPMGGPMTMSGELMRGGPVGFAAPLIRKKIYSGATAGPFVRAHSEGNMRGALKTTLTAEDLTALRAYAAALPETE